MEHHDPSEGAASADQDGYEELDSQIQKQIEDLTLEEEEEEELEELEDEELKTTRKISSIARKKEKTKLQRTRARTAAYPTRRASRDARRRINGSAIRKLGRCRRRASCFTW